MKYLTSELKQKYMEDFNANVLPCTKEYWRIDDGLRDALIKINKNKRVQTLYSKNAKHFYDISYLMLAVTEDYESKVLNLSKKLKRLFHKFSFDIIEPAKFVGDEGINMSCHINEDHFNITVFWFVVSEQNKESNKLFWKYLSDNLVY
jgi:hypothetical protein